MRNIARFLIIGGLFVGCLAVLPATAQHGGGGHGGGGGGFHGGGGGFHGGGGAFRGGGGFRGGYGGFRGGYGGFGRGFYGRNRYFFGFGLGFYPYSYWPYYDYGYPYYGYPYYGYGYGYGYPDSSYDYGYSGYGYSSAPPVVYQSDPTPPAAYDPPRTARPEIREYSTVPSAHSNERPIYLIAFKNQDNIRAAEAYWVTDGTLHFITLQHEQRQAPLGSVDRGLTSRLNRERHVDLHLPTTE